MSLNKAAFPLGINAAVQYGNHLKSIATYLTHYQLLPYKRCKEFFCDLFNHSLSVASILKSAEICYEQLAPITGEIRKLLLQSPVINNDETGYRVNGLRRWLHVVSTPFLTFYHAHSKRGKAAMDAMDLLPRYQGTSVHDYWKSYYHYDCQHALCNAHHLRELTYLHEQDDQQWAKSMIELLLSIKKNVDETKIIADVLPAQQIQTFEQQYQNLLHSNPHLPKEAAKNRAKLKIFWIVSKNDKKRS